MRVRKLKAIPCDIAANVARKLSRAAWAVCGEKEMNSWELGVISLKMMVDLGLITGRRLANE